MGNDPKQPWEFSAEAFLEHVERRLCADFELESTLLDYVSETDQEMPTSIVRNSLDMAHSWLCNEPQDWTPTKYDPRSKLHTIWTRTEAVPDPPQLDLIRRTPQYPTPSVATLVVRRRHLLAGAIPLSAAASALLPSSPKLALLTLIDASTGIEYEAWLDTAQGLLFHVTQLFAENLIGPGSKITFVPLQAIGTFEFIVDGIDATIQAHDLRERMLDESSPELIVLGDAPNSDTPDLGLIPLLNDRISSLTRRLERLDAHIDAALSTVQNYED